MNKDKSWLVSLILLNLILITGLSKRPTLAQDQNPVDFGGMSLEELLKLQITSAGKKQQLITEIPAAIYVITAEDIRRSHATTIMDLLRQVPGIQVAREKTGEWAISVRGFNDKHANKLLVLMDGRTLYSPLYTGVEWDMQDTMIQDIDRIEVIRGPGAALWGANAVNGVINIITKGANETQGGLVTTQLGTLERGYVASRYGGSLGQTAHYRVFSKYFSRPSLPTMAGDTPPGGWNSFRQGGRLDWSPTSRDSLMVSGEWFNDNLRETDDEITSLSPPFESVVEEHDKTRSGFLLTRWNRKTSDRSEFNLQFFYDRGHQYDGRGHDKGELIGTTDVEFSHHSKVRQRHDIVWGGGFRQVRDRVEPAIDSWFDPSSRTAQTYNGFLQDEIGFLNGKLNLTAGSKFEWNTFSNAEVQPTIRLLWAPAHKHSLWTAVSRAVRLPSRNEVDQQSIESISGESEDEISYEFLRGAIGFKPETLTSYEVGYRFTPTKRSSVDFASYYNVYDDLQTTEVGEEFATREPIAGLVTPLIRGNDAFGEAYGGEIVAFWTVSDRLQLSGSYTRLHMNLHRRPWSNDEDAEGYEGKNAKNLFFVRAYQDLPYRFQVNTELRFVGKIPGENVPAYLDGDVRISRSISEGLTLGISMENLLHRRRAEWNYEDGLVQRRGIRGSVEWRF